MPPFDLDLLVSPAITRARDAFRASRALVERRAAAIGLALPPLGDDLMAGLVRERDWLAIDATDGSRFYLAFDATHADQVRHVYGAIGDHYRRMSGAFCYLGGPLGDEADFPDGGRVSHFERGAIYWWPDIGAIDLAGITVNYRGLVCFGETDEWSDSDEPYATIGVITPKGTWPFATVIYDDVDAGESRPDYAELYRGEPGGMVLDIRLIEHDQGDPELYRGAMESVLQVYWGAVGGAIGLIPGPGPVIAVFAAPALQLLAPVMADAFNGLLGTGDNTIGQTAIEWRPKDLILAARAPLLEDRGIVYKLASPLIAGEGASYKLYFEVTGI